MMKKHITIALAVAILSGGVGVAVFTLSGQLSTSLSSLRAPEDSSSASSSQEITSGPAKLVESEFLGLSVNEAVEKAKNYGLIVTIQQGNPAVSESEINTVYFVTPKGELSIGSKVIFTFFGPLLKLNPPGSPPKVEGTSVEPNEDVHLIWQPQVCPNGLTLSGYILEVSGAAVVDQKVFPASVTGALIRTGKTGDTFFASYQYVCGGQESPRSAPFSAIIG